MIDIGFAVFLAVGALRSAAGLPDHHAVLIPPVSMVEVGGHYYDCADPYTGANPSHPAFDPCNGVFDN